MDKLFGRHLLDPAYWLLGFPGPLSLIGLEFLSVIFGVVLLIGIFGKYLAVQRAKEKLVARIYRKLGTLGITMGLLGYLFLFFAYEEIYLFGSRVWFLVWLLGLTSWAIRIVYLAKVKIPEEKKSLSQKQEFERYLPRAKA